MDARGGLVTVSPLPADALDKAVVDDGAGGRDGELSLSTCMRGRVRPGVRSMIPESPLLEEPVRSMSDPSKTSG